MKNNLLKELTHASLAMYFLVHRTMNPGCRSFPSYGGLCGGPFLKYGCDSNNNHWYLSSTRRFICAVWFDLHCNPVGCPYPQLTAEVSDSEKPSHSSECQWWQPLSGEFPCGCVIVHTCAVTLAVGWLCIFRVQVNGSARADTHIPH